MGSRFEQVFRILHESTRQPMPSPVSRVLQEGRIVHLANHTLLCTRDGREVVITDSGAPIRSVNGDLLGVVMVFQDVSAQQQIWKQNFSTPGKSNRWESWQVALPTILIICSRAFSGISPLPRC